MTREYVYAGGALLASISATTTTYYHQDHLSNRLATDSTGAAAENLGAYPYGESWYKTSSEKWLFTSYERDAESGNDYAMARYDVNRFGRFLSTDPLSGSALDPQSLNHYTYTQNDPVNAADPSGMLMIRGYGLVSWGDTGFGSNWGEYIESSVWGQTYSRVGKEILFGAPTLYDEFYWIDFGPSGGPGDQKEKLLIKTALQEKNLSKCLHEFFGPGPILTNANLPRIDASHDLSNGAVGQTDARNVPATGRGTIQIDKGVFRGLAGDDPFLVGIYLHETANVLAIQQFTSITPRSARARLGPLGGPPTAAQNAALDKDIGEQFEHCIRN